MSGLWSAERTESLRTLYAEGLSYSVIATKLGVNRNAIAGKVARLKLPKRNHAPKQQAMFGRMAGRNYCSMGGRAARFKHSKAFRMNLSRRPPSKAFVKAAAVSVAPPDAPPPLNLSFNENNGCMWPGSEPGKWCGHPKHERKSYCEAHCRA